MNAHDRYRWDADVLAAIGASLRGQDDPAHAVIPVELRLKALSAWQRDEQESAEDETAEQQRVREQAATLALIGLGVEQAEGSEYVALHPDTFAATLDAANIRSTVRVNVEPLVGCAVIRLTFDAEVALQLAPPHAGTPSFNLSIYGPFSVTGSGEVNRSAPTGTDDFSAILPLLDTEVLAAEVTPDEALLVSFSNGHSLSVPRHPDVIAWYLTSRIAD